MRTIREIRYTKYKKAVLRKQNGTPEKNDGKLLKKLNKKDFVLGTTPSTPTNTAKAIRTRGKVWRDEGTRIGKYMKRRYERKIDLIEKT